MCVITRRSLECRPGAAAGQGAAGKPVHGSGPVCQPGSVLPRSAGPAQVRGSWEKNVPPCPCTIPTRSPLVLLRLQTPCPLYASRLSTRCLCNPQLASLSVVLFCFNPASVFYSAVYTEALFAACSWWGLVMLPSRHWIGVGLLALASATRSNGILGCWFVLHAAAAQAINRRGPSCGHLLKAATSCAVIVLPYVAMQCKSFDHTLGGPNRNWHATHCPKDQCYSCQHLPC